MMKNSSFYVSKHNLEQYVSNIFREVGLEEGHSLNIARHLVLADLRGIDSHGVTRVKNYTQRLESGAVNTEHEMKIVKETPSSVLIDGANELGIISATMGINIAVKKAKETGLAIVGIKNSNHCGMLADYTTYAAENNCVALATTNAPSNMAPWGGKSKFFGTNPLSYGIPGGVNGDIIFDMATSVVARGKIKLAVKNDHGIPLGWAISKEGEPTTDAIKAMEGLVLPAGGPKGYGLAFFVDVLSGLLTGAAYGPYLGRPENMDEVQKVGQFFFVMRADIFVELETFKNRMDQMANEIKQIPLAVGFDRIYLPGEIEREKAKTRLIGGIPLSLDVIEELIEVGQKYSIPNNLY